MWRRGGVGGSGMVDEKEEAKVLCFLCADRGRSSRDWSGEKKRKKYIVFGG